MKSFIKKHFGYFIAFALIVCAMCAAFVDYSHVKVTTSAEEFVNTAQMTYLTEVGYTVESGGKKVDVSVNKSAVGGGAITLGPAEQCKIFKSGLSFKTVSESSPVILTVPIDATKSFDIFTTDFGVDPKSVAGNARFVFKIDGVTVEEKTLTATDFQCKFETSLDGVNKVTAEVYGKSGMCVSFGDASFYESSPNAVSMLVENAVYGGWPAPISRNANLYGGGLRIGDTNYSYGLCVNSTASFDIAIDGGYKFFFADIGIDEGVAGGSEAGSVSVTVRALDANGRILSSSSADLIYGYMKPYRLTLNTDGAERLRFTVGDGGDGIANDMAVIGNPVFSDVLGREAVQLSGFTPVEYSTGERQLGIDCKATDEPLTYDGAYGLEYKHGLGFDFKNADLGDYLKDTSNTDSFSFVKFDVSGTGAKHIEGAAVMSTGGGAYVEAYADGKKIMSAVKVTPLGSGGTPVRIAADIPEGASELEMRVIAENKDETATLETVNLRLIGGDPFFAKSEVLSADMPYSYGRDVSPFGGSLCIRTDNGSRYLSRGVSLPSGGSVTFAVDGANYFGATLGLLRGDAAEFAVRAELGDGTVRSYVTPTVNVNNSPFALSWYAGEKVKSITLSVNGSGAVGVYGDPVFSAGAPSAKIRVAELEWTGAESGWGTVNVDKDVIGAPIEINGKIYPRGISMHAFNDPDKYAYVQTSIPAGADYNIFSAMIGVSKDNENNGTAGSVRFHVEGNGKRLYSSDLVRVSDDARLIVVDITGITDLKLLVDNGDGSYECDFAVWVDPVIARSSTDLDGYLRLDSPISDQSVVSTSANTFELNGLLLGADNEADISLNGKAVGKVTADRLGKFNYAIKADGFGKNTIRVQSGALFAETDIYIASPIENASEYTLSTMSTRVGFKPANNGVIVTELSRIGGHNWAGEQSFIRFPYEIRVGGENGTPYKLDWKFDSCEYEEKDHTSKKIDVFGNDYVGKHMTYTLYYTDKSGKYKMRSIWSAYSDFAGPVSHAMEFENNSGTDMYVTAADSLSLSLAKPEGKNLTASYAYKGAMYQTSYGYREDHVGTDYSMEVFSSTDYNNGMQIDAGYMPWTTMYSGGEGLNIGVVWSDCRAHIYGADNGAYVKAGLRPRFETVIKSGDALYIPETFVDAYSGSIDDGSNQLKKWLFAFSMPEVNRLDDGLPSFGFNLWELLDQERRSWRMSDKKFYAGVHQLSEMGIEEITVDTYWWKNIGDWRGVHEKWQSSMTYSSNYVHSLGMNFTIYMQAGNGSSLHSDALTAAGINGNPDWFARGDNLFWDELCLADEDAYEYLKSYLKNYYTEHGLDGMRTDFGYLLGYCNKEGHAHIDDRADVGYWTSVNWYKLLDELYELFPVPEDVNGNSEVHYYKWENCNCGGTHKDFASMRRATRVQTTDAFDPLNVRRSFYDASYIFPSMQLMLWMNDYMYNPDGPYPNDNYRFWSMLPGSPCPMISMPSDMSPAMYSSLVNTVKIYKNWMRELVKYGDLYHILPRADGVHWDGVQYFDPDTGKGAALAFKPDPDGTVEDTVTLKFGGVDPEKYYFVWSEEGYIPFKTYKGSELISGIDLTIEGSYGAEIIYLIDTTAQGAAELTRIPDAFDVIAEIRNGGIEINVDITDNADYYVFKIINGADTVYSFISDAEGAICNVLHGLSAGNYTVEVTAYNRFGTKQSLTDFTVENDLEFADALKASGADGGEAVIDGERYVGGDTLDLTDKTFGVSVSRSVEIVIPSGKTDVSFRLALDDADADGTVTLKFYGVNAGVQTLIDTATVTAGQKFADVTVRVSGYEKLTVNAKNTSPNVYVQSAVGYGRTGLYGGRLSADYEFSFDICVLRNGLNETFPRAGGFAAYVDDNNFAAFYIDAYYSNFVIYERSGGRTSDRTVNIKMSDSFDYYANHNLKVVRRGNKFDYFVDGKLITTRTLALGDSRIALITEDAQARYANVVRTVGGERENIVWKTYDTKVDIYGKTVYGTKVTQGVWKRPKTKLVFIAY